MRMYYDRIHCNESKSKYRFRTWIVRFDLYDYEAVRLESLKHADCITLVDYKTELKFCDFDDTCFVELDKDKLEVSL